ncbi:transcriptional regulator [Rhodobacteraceae bacterium RKSG542]|uniref:ArsR/SmtB family transcription factor n=1 Tax=Pseudovibrio flavus TaxID=2529854 RepID=UPI0012BBDD54|nr:metalloregulator ArsR/SmtB family transcription factor [Pseudovibrio flavus]MTI17973.1 transcriptional regulator [Pseudovibrio flavus]
MQDLETDTDLIAFLNAIADPTRLQAIKILAGGEEHCSCELMPLLGATQSRMSRHMQILKQQGIVVDRRDAQWVRFKLNPQLPSHLKAALDAILSAACPLSLKDESHGNCSKQ